MRPDGQLQALQGLAREVPGMPVRVTFGSLKRDRATRNAPFRYTRLKCAVCEYDKELRHVTPIAQGTLTAAAADGKGLHCPRCGGPAELHKI
jgi:hypothetical protein